MTLYAVYCRDENGRRSNYAAEDPETGALVAREGLADGWRIAPAKLAKPQALELARQLQEKTGREWFLELAPNPCPSCSRVIRADDLDFCYPQTRERKTWRAGCNEHDGGCGFEVEGTSFEDVMRKWNRAHKPATEPA
jgi:hypothetical protein